MAIYDPSCRLGRLTAYSTWIRGSALESFVSRFRFVNFHLTTSDVGRVQLFNCFLGLVRIGHLDECKTARTPSFAILDNLN